MRIRMDVEFDGTDYCGWQRQNNGIAVQQKVEDALLKLLQVPTAVTGAGRTDAGVHALCMTCHFDAETKIPPHRLCYALNYLLPQDIRVKSTTRARNDFHARFDARAKWYRYRILTHPQRSALYHRLCWHVPYALDATRMKRALLQLVGTHDFAAFMASGANVKSTVRTLYEARLTQHDPWLVLDVLGNGFLYNMVRIIAGTLIDIGRGKCQEDVYAKMIQSKDRLSGGVTAPPQGLMLMHVFYDEDGDFKQNWAQMVYAAPW